MRALRRGPAIVAMFEQCVESFAPDYDPFSDSDGGEPPLTNCGKYGRARYPQEFRCLVHAKRGALRCVPFHPTLYRLLPRRPLVSKTVH